MSKAPTAIADDGELVEVEPPRLVLELDKLFANRIDAPSYPLHNFIEVSKYECSFVLWLSDKYNKVNDMSRLNSDPVELECQVELTSFISLELELEHILHFDSYTLYFFFFSLLLSSLPLLKDSTAPSSS